MKVWVVLDWWDHDQVTVDSVWSSKELADAEAEAIGNNAQISEHFLDGESDLDGLIRLVEAGRPLAGDEATDRVLESLRAEKERRQT